MSWRNTPERYGRLSIALHWLMVAQLAGVYACINLYEWFPKGSAPRAEIKTWHFMLGLSVLAVVVLRLAARWSGVTPSPLPGTPPWQRRLASLTHAALYVLLVGMPVLGWLALSADGKPVPFFGAILPPLTSPDQALAHRLEDIHGSFGVIGYYLIGLHAAAALFHHYVRRDGTLLRMLPARRPDSGRAQ
jgi:cytochrome b561